MGLGADEEATIENAQSMGVDKVIREKREGAAAKVTGVPGGISSNWMKMKAVRLYASVSVACRTTPLL